MVRGTAWLTAVISLAASSELLYIIPWYAWMGKYAAEADALLEWVMKSMPFLLISTVGIPVAVAKQVSKYNTLGDPKKYLS